MFIDPAIHKYIIDDSSIASYVNIFHSAFCDYCKKEDIEIKLKINSRKNNKSLYLYGVIECRSTIETSQEYPEAEFKIIIYQTPIKEVVIYLDEI